MHRRHGVFRVERIGRTHAGSLVAALGEVPPAPRPCFHNESMRASKSRVDCIQ